MRVFSFGGGVQSMAVLVLAAQGKLQYDAFVFSNVGEDSENPETIVYFREIALPYAQENGIELVEVQKTLRDGTLDTLVKQSERAKTFYIPAYIEKGGPGRRSCTKHFKIMVVAKWLKKHGASKEEPATVGLGISMDEISRARSDSPIAWQRLEYPLLDLQMNRQDCLSVIQDSGLPAPPKSACFFCPFKKHNEWLELRRTQPELFDKSVALEKMINKKQADLGKPNVYLHRGGIPLEDAVGLQFSLFEDDACESGYCFT